LEILVSIPIILIKYVWDILTDPSLYNVFNLSIELFGYRTMETGGYKYEYQINVRLTSVQIEQVNWFSMDSFRLAKTSRKNSESGCFCWQVADDAVDDVEAAVIWLSNAAKSRRSLEASDVFCWRQKMICCNTIFFYL